MPPLASGVTTTTGYRPARRVLAALALAAATGCFPLPSEPAPGGMTGVTVNADGHLTLVAAWCEQPPDGVVIYRRVNGEHVDQADLTAPPLTGSTVSLDLEHIPPGWSLTSGDLDFVRGRKYMGSAYSLKTHVRMYDVVFTTESKKRVRPGQVIITEYGEQDGETGHDVLVSTAEFNARAPHFC